jgi:superfamily II DNA helicase RecQ
MTHYLVPESPEQYHQEVGRAGRDGQPASAYLLFTDTRPSRFLSAAGSLSGFAINMPSSRDSEEYCLVLPDKCATAASVVPCES